MTISSPVELFWSCHRALLDPMHGTGLLVRPRPAEDVVDPFADGTAPTVHETELCDVVLPHLDRLGYEPSPAEDAADEWDWLVEGLTPEGLEVVALLGREPIVSSPGVEEIAASFAVLRRAAGLWPSV